MNLHHASELPLDSRHRAGGTLVHMECWESKEVMIVVVISIVVVMREEGGDKMEYHGSEIIKMIYWK